MLGLGFDTGGTYTDAVLVDLENGKVIGKRKALTTRDDLSIGIRNSVKGFDEKQFKDVVMVSLSSTLATNSIVEGKGCRVGLISVGEQFDNSIPTDVYAFVKGGHTLSGEEQAPLDEDAVKEALKAMKDKVDGVAITSFLSVRNPDHEVRVKKIATELLNVPIVCGHELSSSLGFNERTVTSVMNARLIPIIKELMDSVKNVMNEHKIKAPLMIVKGDGSIMGESIALGRPIETILSGPASSLIGAKNLTGRADAIVVDIGGTTTDIGILRNGHPRLEKEGAVIGGRRTRVLAAEIATSGIGGDSRLIVNGGKFMMSSLRVVPLCIAADQWSVLKEKLKKAADMQTRPTPESLNVSNILQDIEFFIKLKDIKHVMLSEADIQFMESISKEPKSLNEVGDELNIHPFIFNVGKMEELGMIQRIGITPTDLLHAEESYVEYDAEASKNGVLYQAKRMRMTTSEFIDYAKDFVVYRLSEEILRKLFFEETGTMALDTVGKDVMDKFIRHSEGLDYSCRITLNKPIIGIGAPVAAYLPQVAKKFNVELLLPEHSEVGNAIGAITGSITESIEVLITPKAGKGGDHDPPCTVFSILGRVPFETSSEAMEYVKKDCVAYVQERAKSAGADYIDIKIDVDEKKYSLGYGFGDDQVVLETEVKVTAVGKPKQFIRTQKVQKSEYEL